MWFSVPQHEVKVVPKDKNSPFKSFGMVGGYRFEAWFDGDLIGMSGFEFIGVAQARKAGEVFCSYFVNDIEE